MKHKVKKREFCIGCGKVRDGSQHSRCIECRKEYLRQYNEINKDMIKKKRDEYYAANREMLNERSRKSYRANREKRLEAHREYYKLNKEVLSERNRIWRENNKQRIAENDRRYRKENPEVRRRAHNKRRALKLQNNHEPYTEKMVLELYGSNCHICNLPIDINANRSPGADGWELSLHLDHIIPISKGGDDNIKNVRPSHGKCNVIKGDKIISSAAKSGGK